MNLILQLACVATLALCAYGQACTEIDNCGTCPDPELLCFDCIWGWGLARDNRFCKQCPDFCLHCKPRINTNDQMDCLDCAGHYVLRSDKTCAECGEFCSECSWMTKLELVTTCSDCASGSVLWIDPADGVGKCLRCPDRCIECSANPVDGALSCSRCIDGYFKKQSDGSCKSCPSRCTSCVDDGNGKGFCSKCQDGFVVRSEDPTKSCLTCPSTCTSCLEEVRTGSIAKCSACRADRWLEADECVMCEGSDRCLQCNDISDCGVCRSGFRRTDVGACDSCRAFCMNCDTDVEQCDKCQSFFGAKDAAAPTCDLCGPNCRTCTSDRRCANCNTGYALDVGAGTCKVCPSNCNTCSYSSIAGRTQCNTGACAGVRITTALGDCTDCPIGCTVAACRETNGIVRCTSCNSPPTGTFMQFNTDLSICQYCPSRCDQCVYNSTLTEMECTRCITGNGLDFTNTGFPICSACDGCDRCGFNDTINAMDCLCSNWGPATVGTGSGIDNRGGGCTTGTACAAGKVYIADGVGDTSKQNDYCTNCLVPGCLTCNTTMHCFLCNAAGTPRYAAASTPQGDCIQCPSAPMCTSCSLNAANDATLCTACIDGFGVNTGACQACSPGCRTCMMIAGTMTCTDCMNEYALVTGACQRCDSKCLTCSSSAQCTACKTDRAYALSSGRCYNCPSNCVTCSYDANIPKTVCSACTGPFVLDTDNGECLPCPDNCNACEMLNGAPACLETRCANNYGRKDSGLCEMCSAFCTDCTANTEDVLVCDTCQNGYRRNEEVCSLCPSKCTECSNIGGTMICSKCSTGNTLRSADNKCITCPSNCNMTAGCGLKGDVSTCKVCNVGFGKNSDSTKCVACATLTEVDSCRLCTDARSDGTSTCEHCNMGYTISDDMGECLDDTSLGAGCIHRYDEPRYCSECDSGFGPNADASQCVVRCQTCGVALLEDGTMSQTPSLECNDPSVNFTSHVCPTGVCAVHGTYDKVKGKRTLMGAVRGCFNETCAAEDQFEKCRKVTKGMPAEICSKCCTTDLCNNEFLDGKSKATFATLHALLAVLIAATTLRQILPQF